MKRVGIILVLAVIVLTVYTLALAQIEVNTSGYYQRMTAAQEEGGL